ncbi:ribose-5-phosphate isomerase RpiA [Enterobacteriaceae endosymbiont of Neohaemonia nigricornis]|uniref:ribose-5-phosphate isomerase RpiA n=1 Tax=Enterobacteriaceae endosymbiont of Neohaemonia nigricornis TaxID=2675792 RepID=UPI00144A064C|nr:ribose-5-phosphate isomerase RpiA [Enterobacteriaceae endosymbiont of Neohaemonia nigricornis]QJC30389.1 ribose-5-phosphate isomerase RpiA [Enterobacteriaceae endosymbiont of Neohaemonia nigricornis]
MLNKLKTNASKIALEYIKKNQNIIGIGSGTTIINFINMLGHIKKNIKGIVAASELSIKFLKKYNFNIYEINHINDINIYFDSADEINNNMQMIKGGGGALTNEKIIANFAKIFICIVDQSKIVNYLGAKHPLPIEIIPQAQAYITRIIQKLGAKVKYRSNFITEHGNIILDIYNLQILDPIKIEKYINNIPGVITVGLFAKRPADILLIGEKNLSVTIKYNNTFYNNYLYKYI